MAVAAQTFAAARTAENFRAWSKEAPAEAAQYLRSVAQTVGNVAVLNQLDQLDAAPAPALSSSLFSQLEAASIGATQAARSATLGWEASGPPIDPPLLTGRLTVATGAATLQTEAGTFSLKTGSILGLNDISAFAGKVVSVRGWPEQAYQPGASATLIAEQWAPGVTTNFASGRIKVVNGEVFIATGPNRDVKIAEPPLAEALKTFDRAGIIIRGTLESRDGRWQLNQAAGDFYVLGGFRSAGTPTPEPTNPELLNFQFELGHGKKTNGVISKALWDATTRGQRHFALGHFESGSFRITSLTANVPYTGDGTQQRGTANLAFAVAATPVGVSTYAPEEAAFEV